MACLKDVLSQLPDGLNSSLGDRGKFLSVATTKSRNSKGFVSRS